MLLKSEETIIGIFLCQTEYVKYINCEYFGRVVEIKSYVFRFLQKKLRNPKVQILVI